MPAKMERLPLRDVPEADVVGEVARVEFRRIRIQRGKGHRVREIYLKLADGEPIEMIDGAGAVVEAPPISVERLAKIRRCQPWTSSGGTWTPRACRAATYLEARGR